MLEFSAENLVFKMLRPLIRGLILARELDQFGWIRLNVQVTSRPYCHVLVRSGGITVVITAKMLECAVKPKMVRIE